MKKKSIIVLMAAMCLAVSGCNSTEKAKNNDTDTKQESEEKIEIRDLTDATEEEAWDYAEEIISTIKEKEPKLGDYEVSIEDFGFPSS